MSRGVEQNVIGLDVNCCRLRAVSGLTGAPQSLALDDGDELPLAISLEGRRPEVGRAGERLRRQSPHLACLDFLPHLGEPRRWSVGRHRLDAALAMALVLERLPAACTRAHGLVLSAPAYLSDTSVSILTALLEKARLRVLGVAPTPLALALAAFAEHSWVGSAVVLDSDAHALTAAVVKVEGSEARLDQVLLMPELGLRVWRERLLNAVADACIQQSRRDLRDSAAAEQSVYEQLDGVLHACQRGQRAELAVHAGPWYQNLILEADDLAAFCAPLVRQTLAVVRSLREMLGADDQGNVILLSAAAGRLPGLSAALESEIEEAMAAHAESQEDDFGEGLLEEGFSWSAGLHVLSPDAAARASCELAGRIQRGEVASGRLSAAPLPAQQSLDAGPARLQFRGKDHPIESLCFTLGRQPDCDLVFDSGEYPSVSARHCEVVYDRRMYHLRDWSRNGTLLNDRPVTAQTPLRPGDWIRLGPGGPLLRFLGRGVDQLKLMTTA